MAADANERSEDSFCSMKITQEVRNFAARQTLQDDTFLVTAPAVRPEPVEGPPLPSTDEEKSGASTGSARTVLEEAEVEQGMAEMSSRFKEHGGQIYLRDTAAPRT